MVEQEQSIVQELSRIAASAIGSATLSDFISNNITSLFAAKYYMIWLINDGRTQPFLYSSDDELTGNLHTQKLIKTSFNLDDGVWDDLLKAGEPAIIDLARLMKLKTVPPWAPLWHNQGLREMLAMPIFENGRAKGFFCLYGNRISAVAAGNMAFLKTVTLQIFACIKSLELRQTILEQQDEIARLKKHSRQTNDGEAQTEKFGGIVGAGTEIKKVIHLVSLVAPTDTTVLLTGETGTGKEVIARAIHNMSDRAAQPIIKVNCAALPANLIESELFGHEKGSFTGALERRNGKFEQAEGGTIFLDEIGELPLELQVRLLRVLQEKEIERIGGNAVFKVNVRVIAATNKDLLKAIAGGHFRSDLYFRLNIFPIHLPPLRQRREDIAALTTHFIEKFAARKGKKVRLAASILHSLQAYPWPGNIRELENVIERSLLNTQGDTLAEINLPDNQILESQEKPAQFSVKTLAAMEKEYILKVVKYCGGKISGPHGAALKLGLPSTTLKSKMEKLGIRKEPFVG